MLLDSPVTDSTYCNLFVPVCIAVVAYSFGLVKESESDALAVTVGSQVVLLSAGEPREALQ